jgi:copper(I)-binding protein
MRPIICLVHAAAIAAASLAGAPSTAVAAAGWRADALRPDTVVAPAASQTKSYRLGALLIEAPWTRATPGGAQVAGGYVKITNKGTEADRLIGGSLPMASSVEVHEMSMTDGIMKMRRLEAGLEIKPGQTVELKPGGHHIMFMGLSEGLKEGRTVKGTLTFEKAGKIEVEFRVAPIGATKGSTPGGASGGRHSHH